MEYTSYVHIKFIYFVLIILHIHMEQQNSQNVPLSSQSQHTQFPVPTYTSRALFFEKLSFYVLLAVSFLIPIFFLPVSFISTQFSTSLLFAFGVIISLVLYIISRFMSGSIDLPRRLSYVLGLFVVVPVVYMLAGLVNGFSRMTFLGISFDESTVGFILLSFVYLFLVSTLFRDKKRIFYSQAVFLISAIILSVFLLIRFIFGPQVLSLGLFTDLTATPLGSWNNVGIFFCVGALLSFITQQMLSVSKIVKVLLAFALALSLFFLVVVNFNFIWIILAITSLLFIMYSFLDPSFSSSLASRMSFLGLKSDTSSVSEHIPAFTGPRSSTLSRLPVYSVVVFCISVIFLFWGTQLSSHVSTFFKIAPSVEARPSLGTTVDIARQTIKAHPLFGSGPNTFVMQWLSYKPDAITSTVFWNTDFSYGIGLLPTFAVTTGLFGILSWLLFFGMYLYLGWKGLFAKMLDPLSKYLVVSSFFISLSLWIMTVIYVPSTIIFILAFFFTGLFLASISLPNLKNGAEIVADTGGEEQVVLAYESTVFSRDPKINFLWSLLLVSLLLASIALAYGLWKNAESLWHFQKSSHALNVSKDITLSEVEMNKAIVSVPYDTYYRSLSEIEVTKLGLIVSQDPKKVSQADLQAQVQTTLSNAIRAGIAARDADPANYLNWISLGRVYQSAVPLKITGAYESAQFSYNEALRRNPKNPGIVLLFAQLEVDHANLAAARSYAIQAINAKQNYLDAYYLLAQIEVADKNLKGAIDSVTAATVLSPSDATLFFQLGLLKYNAQDFAGAIVALSKSLSLSPQYANAKYFLGLSYEATGDHAQAIAQFQDLKSTNGDNTQIDQILTALLAGKPIFQNSEPAATTKTTQTGSKLPVKEKIQ